jgi:hypothetical protein
LSTLNLNKKPQDHKPGRRLIKIFTALIVLALVGGYVYWQQNKKHIVRAAIEKALAKKTDSLYYVEYDSSLVDEVSGTAAFFHVSLQSDSVQKKMLESNDSLPAEIFNIKVDEVKAAGIDVAGFINKRAVSAGKITLVRPFIHIIHTGEGKPKPFTYEDTLALYKKIVGKYESIHADTIQVVNGSVIITNRKGKSLSTFENINVVLNKFIVDSNHDYKNIISYFVHDMRMTIENIQLPETVNDTRINIEKMEYDAKKKILHVNKILQYKSQNSRPLIDLNNISVEQLNTHAFIISHLLQANTISCDGGLISVYKTNGPKAKTEKTIYFSSELIDEAQLNQGRFGNTAIVMIDPVTGEKDSMMLSGIKFILSDGVEMGNTTTLSALIKGALWKISFDNLSMLTKNKQYKITVNHFDFNNKTSSGTIADLSVKSQLSEAAFVKQSRYQRDRYDFDFKNIRMDGFNLKKLIADKTLEINSVSVQPSIKVFNDRTLPPRHISKLGKYPHQQLRKLKMPLYIKTVNVSNGLVVYTERAQKSQQKGTVFFNNINGTLSNTTNLESRIKNDGNLHLRASCLFLGVTKLTSAWRLPLSSTNSNFTVTGQLDPMQATALNDLIEPLAMASTEKGDINKLGFTVNGDDYNGRGEVLILYHDLKIKLLKKTEEEELKKKGFASFIANTLLKNNNPDNDIIRKGVIDFKREINKSFFNLLWKSIFSGVKDTMLR